MSDSDRFRSLVAALHTRADQAEERRPGSGDPSYYAGLVTAYREVADDLASLIVEDEDA